MGQSGYTPSRENLAARQWFQDAKFGMFIHWGVYSRLADGEWVQHSRKIPVDKYEWLATTFNPAKFNAADVVGLAKAAGMKYITVTSKHHDGFAMFDSKVSDWDVMDRTPFRRDVIRELAEECRRQGLTLFVYYSQLDWHHPDYPSQGTAGQIPGRQRPGNPSFPRYLDYMDGQLRELFSGYGPLGGVWFDGMWDLKDADWRLGQTYNLIHELQPKALIISNHHLAPIPGEDVQTFEQDLPGNNSAGFNTTTIGNLPLESSATMNGSWGFNISDTSFKSTTELIRLLVKAAGNNSNLLLNIGPMPTGEVQSEAATRLHAMGVWLQTFAPSIYGTRGGPITPRAWGVTTQRGNLVYVHVLDWNDPSLAIPTLPRRVQSARVLKTGDPVHFTETPAGVVLLLPRHGTDDADVVVELTLADGTGE